MVTIKNKIESSDSKSEFSNSNYSLGYRWPIPWLPLRRHERPGPCMQRLGVSTLDQCVGMYLGFVEVNGENEMHLDLAEFEGSCLATGPLIAYMKQYGFAASVVFNTYAGAGVEMAQHAAAANAYVTNLALAPRACTTKGELDVTWVEYCKNQLKRTLVPAQAVTAGTLVVDPSKPRASIQEGLLAQFAISRALNHPRVLLINPSLQVVRALEGHCDLDVLYTQNLRSPVEVIATDGALSVAVAAFLSGRGLIGVAPPNSLSVESLLAYSSAMGLPNFPSLVFSMSAAYIDDAEYFHLAQSMRLISPNASLNFLMLELLPPELRAMCVFEKKKWSARGYSCEADAGLIKLRGPDGDIQMRPARAWLQKFRSAPEHTLAVPGVTDVAYCPRDVVNRVGDYVLTLDTYSVLLPSSRTVPLWSKIGDFILVRAPCPGKFSGVSEAEGRASAVLCSQALYGALASVNLPKYEPVNKNGYKEDRERTETELKQAFMSAASVKQATLRLFDEEVHSALLAMDAETRRVVLLAAYQWASNQFYGVIERPGVFPFLVRFATLPMRMFSATYVESLTSKLKYGSHNQRWLPTIEVAYRVPSASIYREEVNPRVRIVTGNMPTNENCLRAVGEVVELVGRRLNSLAEFFTLVRGKGDCIYKALLDAGFQWDRRATANMEPPLKTEEMMELLTDIAEKYEISISVVAGRRVTYLGKPVVKSFRTGVENFLSTHRVPQIQFRLQTLASGYHLIHTDGKVDLPKWSSAWLTDRIRNLNLEVLSGMTLYQQLRLRDAFEDIAEAKKPKSLNKFKGLCLELAKMEVENGLRQVVLQDFHYTCLEEDWKSEFLSILDKQKEFMSSLVKVPNTAIAAPIGIPRPSHSKWEFTTDLSKAKYAWLPPLSSFKQAFDPNSAGYRRTVWVNKCRKAKLTLYDDLPYADSRPTDLFEELRIKYETKGFYVKNPNGPTSCVLQALGPKVAASKQERADEVREAGIGKDLVKATQMLADLDYTENFVVRPVIITGAPGSSKSQMIKEDPHLYFVVTETRVNRDAFVGAKVEAYTKELAALHLPTDKIMVFDEFLQMGADSVVPLLLAQKGDKHEVEAVFLGGEGQIQSIDYSNTGREEQLRFTEMLTCMRLYSPNTYRLCKKVVNAVNRSLLVTEPIICKNHHNGDFFYFVGRLPAIEKQLPTDAYTITITNDMKEHLGDETAHRAQGATEPAVNVVLDFKSMLFQSQEGRSQAAHLFSAITRSAGDVRVYATYACEAFVTAILRKQPIRISQTYNGEMGKGTRYRNGTIRVAKNKNKSRPGKATRERRRQVKRVPVEAKQWVKIEKEEKYADSEEETIIAEQLAEKARVAALKAQPKKAKPRAPRDDERKIQLEEQRKYDKRKKSGSRGKRSQRRSAAWHESKSKNKRDLQTLIDSTVGHGEWTGNALIYDGTRHPINEPIAASGPRAFIQTVALPARARNDALRATFTTSVSPYATGLMQNELHESLLELFSTMWPNVSESERRFVHACRATSEIMNTTPFEVSLVDFDYRTRERLVFMPHSAIPSHNARDKWLTLHTVVERFCTATPYKIYQYQSKLAISRALADRRRLRGVLAEVTTLLVRCFDPVKLRAYGPKIRTGEAMMFDLTCFYAGQAVKAGGISRINKFRGSEVTHQSTIVKTQNKSTGSFSAHKLLSKLQKTGQPVNNSETLYADEFAVVTGAIHGIVARCTVDNIHITSVGGNTVESARILIQPFVSKDDLISEDDITGCDASHYMEEVTCVLEPAFNEIGAIAGVKHLGTRFRRLVEYAQAAWQTTAAPGANFKFKIFVKWILSSGLKWTLSLNSLRCLADHLAQKRQLPKWYIGQGDDSVYCSAAETDPEYARLTGIRFKPASRPMFGSYCGRIFASTCLHMSVDLPKMALKFLSAPMPTSRAGYAKRLCEVQQALRDLMPADLHIRELTVQINSKFYNLPEDSMREMYDYVVRVHRASVEWSRKFAGRMLFTHPLELMAFDKYVEPFSRADVRNFH